MNKDEVNIILETVYDEFNDYLTDLYADRDVYSRARIIEDSREKLKSIINSLKL